MKKDQTHIKGRGAQHNTTNRFLKDELIYDAEMLLPGKNHPEHSKTQYISIFPKTIINKVDSPDVGMDYSINPYQGCEHGCAYCYARNTHEFWGYSAGIEFEQKILVKENVPELLLKKLANKNWIVKPITLSGNTDCYQPAERKYKITRRILEIMLECQHPVGIITKNSLITRDLDIIQPLNDLNLIKVNISLTTLDDKLRQKLEPRTASVAQRLKTIQTLSSYGVPVNVMLAPIIPGINSDEIPAMVERVAQLGAKDVNCIMVRLNGRVAEIFTNWIEKTFPEKSAKVLSLIKQGHDGKLNDSRFGTRMRGTGPYMKQLGQLLKVLKQRHFKQVNMDPYNTGIFKPPGKSGQLRLF